MTTIEPNNQLRNKNESENLIILNGSDIFVVVLKVNCDRIADSEFSLNCCSLCLQNSEFWQRKLVAVP